MSVLTKIYHIFSTSQQNLCISVCGKETEFQFIYWLQLCTNRNTLQGFMNLEQIARVHHSDKHVKIKCVHTDQYH